MQEQAKQRESIEAPNGVELSKEALEALEKLEIGEQKRISAGLAEVYYRVTSFLVSATYQPFLSREQTFQLNYLTNTFQTFIVGGFPVRVQVCSDTYKWTIVSIGEAGKANFEIVKLV